MEARALEWLYSLSNIFGAVRLSLVMLFVLYILLLTLWKFFHIEGVYLYNTLAVVLGNIQVLKMSYFGFFSEPVALGTIIFATTFTATDILTEHIGVEEAKKSIKISFLAQAIVMIIMFLTILFPTEGGIMGFDKNGKIINDVQYSLYVLFVPSVRITVASIISYYVCQLVDIYVFKLVSNITKKKMVWLRFNIASLVSGMCDNILFSVLAWVVFAPNPVSFKTLVVTYIFGTYFGRIVVTFMSTPIMYLSSALKR